jgi:hypothetical protein
MVSKTAQLRCAESACRDCRKRGFRGKKTRKTEFSQLVNFWSAVWPRECKIRAKDPNPDVPRRLGFSATCSGRRRIGEVQ